MSEQMIFDIHDDGMRRMHHTNPSTLQDISMREQGRFGGVLKRASSRFVGARDMHSGNEEFLVTASQKGVTVYVDTFSTDGWTFARDVETAGKWFAGPQVDVTREMLVPSVFRDLASSRNQTSELVILDGEPLTYHSADITLSRRNAFGFASLHDVELNLPMTEKEKALDEDFARSAPDSIDGRLQVWLDDSGRLRKRTVELDTQVAAVGLDDTVSISWKAQFGLLLKPWDGELQNAILHQDHILMSADKYPVDLAAERAASRLQGPGLSQN